MPQRVSKPLSSPLDLNERYQALVDRKYTVGLSDADQAEMDSLSARLSEDEAAFYHPILAKLRETAAKARRKASSSASKESRPA